MRKLRTLKRVRSFFSVIMQEKHGTMRARKARTAKSIDIEVGFRESPGS